MKLCSLNRRPRQAKAAETWLPPFPGATQALCSPKLLSHSFRHTSELQDPDRACFTACLGEKSYICSKYFAFSSLSPISILISSSGSWLCNNMSSINSSYITPVRINLRCQQAFAHVATFVLSPILLLCSYTKGPLECSPRQVGWVAKVATQHYGVRQYCSLLDSSVYLERGWGYFCVESH